MTFDYDLFVIGTGPGGLAAAKKAASYGVRVAMAEQETIGGTCVNRGCVPKKLIVYAADFAKENQMAHSYGWSKCQRYFDWTLLMKSVHRHIEHINYSYCQQLRKAEIEIIKERATFIDAHTLDLNGHRVTADKILIAVGGKPNKPDIPGIEYAITSREMFHLPYLPKRLTIIGGGYIGAEFSSMMQALGCEVTLIEADEMILSGFDDDIRSGVQDGLRKRGIRIITNSRAEEITHLDDGWLLKTTGDCAETMAADTILVATGWSPNTQNLGLEKAKVEVGQHGEIKVDEYYCTTQSNIFAVGDCINRMQLTPVAKAEGIAFANTVFGNNRQRVNYDYVPSAVFSRPEGAGVGMTEAEARAKFGESVKCYSTKLQPLFYQLLEAEEPAMIKLVVDDNSQQVLGAHMLGENAAEIVQTLGVAIRQGITKQVLNETIGIHPTIAEDFLSLD
ncbi:glutathione-disulfide reductase [Nodularia sphaerocarpa]|uniref:glutathione-disulfide reductase n=2 Tax=Nodularia sphaerocarpa TaxID=137816 RepID=UPI001EFA5FF6|nr:glutathione-disulfide reductase [Nodularia sphaerocarpa]MDB9376230.1 glutathione-disulfide reductase [Nodularia sphaerocarpa CS-585]ULP74324.1 Glutathione amide reductase [Nodularia sphaerocarpa UHCC 0038]